ncbi:MAG: histidine kinase [Dehalococcoidia bacterium]|nr:histidine kinase [Dehalococcoidia bacterium]
MIKESLWADIWAKIGAVGIRTKIMGIVAVCILCSALALVWYTYRDDSTFLRNQLRERGIAIGTELATHSLDLVLTHNQFALYTLVRDTRNTSEDVIYTFVLDARGNVMVHTFSEGFPSDLLDANKVPPGAAYGVQVLQTGDDTIQDIAVPLLGGKAGVVRIGLSEAKLSAALQNHIRNILLWVAVILVLGLVIAYGLASILTGPFAQLADAARAAGKGEFRWKAPIWAKDELGSLGSAFNEMSAELKHKEEMRVHLLAKVIDAQESERKRIARELHDETSQSLTSLMVGLKSIEDVSSVSQAKEKATELRALAAQTLNEVHNLAVELRPSLLDDLGLASAIQRYAEEYSAKMNINIDSHVSGLSEQRLPPEIEVAVYRIIQEALTNIAKYAGAKNVSIVLRRRDSSLVAIVEDDGKGFDVNETMFSSDGKQLGLFGMYERASLIGGKLSIESYPGSGTTVFLEVPLKLDGRDDGQNKIASG